MKKVIIIGAGAAGMMAAFAASKRQVQVILCEKNKRAGKKLLITGKGRCNVTNNTDVQGLIDNIPGNGDFLYSAFYTFSNSDIMDFFENHGVNLKVERGDRVFPVSDKAVDIVDALKSGINNKWVDFIPEAAVREIICKNQKVSGVLLTDGKVIEGDSVILATGGASYPLTGSTGDGYAIAKKLGHSIIDIKPSLVPLESRTEWIREVQGLSLKNVEVVFRNKAGKKVYEDFGEMLFTHFGVSGPVVLSASRHLLEYNYRNLILQIDLKPALNEEKLDERLKRDFEKYSRKQFKNSLDDLLPSTLIPVIVKLSEIPPDKFINQITKEERKKLLGLLKCLEVEINNSRPVDEAIVTAGGVCTDEINPSTMESKLVKGLYLAGEVIDVDGYTGGFNLTIAFSTGYVAGMNC